uniref:R3H domain-containing protein n=1 Tax=Scophthalmus maximus TaxID=52904 RepID=A0A8D3A867_SCOMX
MAFPCFDGIYLPKQENEFVHLVMDDLETYQQKSSRDSVLLFPCLPSRLRYLIHKTIEELPELTTFSVGESWCRRVAVLHSELRYKVEEMDGLAKPKPSIPSRSRGLKRPDKPLYMPRAARERLSLQNSEGPAMHEESPSPASRSCSCITSSPDSRSSNETTEDTKPSSTSRQESFPSIKAHLKEAVSFSIELVHNDYSIYENVCVNQDEFRHVIEIYDFPPIFKTDDLLDAFTDYSDGGMKIKWVDNTHALGVFSNESEGINSLRWSGKWFLFQHCMTNRRLLLCFPPEFIQPVKERPRTDSAVAKRMVTRALGLQGRGRVPRY